jgi:uncharacterized repeat protein (TIGR03803 family)
MTKLNWVTKACGVFLLWATGAIALPAQTFATLYSFDGTEGEMPQAPLIQAIDGNFYGTTFYGGTESSYCMQNTVAGCGTVFKVTPSGTLTTLYSFCSIGDCPDGLQPYAGLAQGRNGNLYGTTDGTIFEIPLSGTLTTLYSFDGADFPYQLLQGNDGNFYGTTAEGGFGAHCGQEEGCGTVFRITPSGTLTTLYSFASKRDYADGAYPEETLVQAANGDLFGTTAEGGTSNACRGGCGTVFKITPSGMLTTLHSFDLTDGQFPAAGLAQGTDGNFYGTTFGAGGEDNSYGTVFKITPSGTLTTLYSFCSTGICTTGYQPSAPLVQATDGNFYGTTQGGGSLGLGTVFEITPSGSLTTLHSFDGTDGHDPEAGLIQSTNGSFYGTTYYGGASDYGTVYSLSVGLGPFVETQPTSGPAGGTVKILGTDLTGATSVSFNGTAAVFTVDSHSLIAATVPTGATTGTVQVVTPRSGTLSSNVPFTVRP